MAIIMYKVKYKLLLKNILKLFRETNVVMFTRQRDKFKQMYVRTTLKAMCMTTVGVKLWNSLFACLRNFKNNSMFKVGTIYLLLRDIQQ